MEEQLEFFDEVSEAGSGYRCIHVPNYHDFKTPLTAAIADSDNERRFINMLLHHDQPTPLRRLARSPRQPASTRLTIPGRNVSTQNAGKFNPDFFIKAGELIIVVEVKGDEELQEPSEENRKKNEYAIAHFKRINEHLEQEGSPIRYKFTFLTPASFNKFFQSLRDGTMVGFRSELDVKLAEEA